MSSCCPSTKKDESASCASLHQKKRLDLLLWGSLAGVIILYGLGILEPAFLQNINWLGTMSHAAHHMVHAIWWGVLIGMVFVGLMAKIPREFILSILGPGGSKRGLIRATGAGVLLDLCSHGILMVGAKLYERGASIGQVIAFLMASPWNSFSLTLVLVGLIGVKWTLSFIMLSMVIALVTGWIFDRLVDRGLLPENQNRSDIPKDFKFWSEAKKGIRKTKFDRAFFRSMFRSALTDSQMVLRWLLFGILLAAILRAILNPEQFGEYFGPTVIGLTITVFVATILEVCSEGSAPIAADIINRAGAPGNGFAFLMAGVATDYTEVMVLKDTTKSWKIALFLPLISLPQIIVVAWLINLSI